MVGHSGGIEIKIIARRYFFFLQIRFDTLNRRQCFSKLSGIVINKLIKPDADVRL